MGSTMLLWISVFLVSANPIKMAAINTNDIEAQLDFFMKEFKNNEKYPAANLTAEQLAWFYSIGTFEAREGKEDNYRQKRSALDPNRKRKEYRTLTTGERNNLHSALINMKTTMVGSMSEYDIFVEMHKSVNAPAAHGGAAFLVWHREYLWRFELALQGHAPSGVTIMLPYWNNQLDQSLPSPADSALWTPSYLGNNNGDVTTGFAASWAAIPGCTSIGSTLRRNAVGGVSGQAYLFTDPDVNTVLSATDYNDIYCQYNCDFEHKHGFVHVFLGPWSSGHMGNAQCSPNDPTFWLHHAYIDCLWEEYRNIHPNPEMDYPPAGSPAVSMGGALHDPYANMAPFGSLFNVHGLSNHYTNYYYSCAARHDTCTTHADCGSSILYCDTTEGKCRAKVRKGGDCTGLTHTACDRTQCNIGQAARCVANVCTCQWISATSLPWHAEIKKERFESPIEGIRS